EWRDTRASNRSARPSPAATAPAPRRRQGGSAQFATTSGAVAWRDRRLARSGLPAGSRLSRFGLSEQLASEKVQGLRPGVGRGGRVVHLGTPIVEERVICVWIGV